MRIYETMRRAAPRLLHPQRRHDLRRRSDPGRRKMAKTARMAQHRDAEKIKVAETLAEFRGNYKYNLLDENVRRFNAEVPQIWQWDDHEVTNNWSSSKDLSANARYTREERAALDRARRTRVPRIRAAAALSATRRASECTATSRTARCSTCSSSTCAATAAPNTFNRETERSADTAFLGPRAARLAEARAQPLEGDMEGDRGRHAARACMVATAPTRRPARFENSANGDGPALGRELEIASLLRFIKRAADRQRRVAHGGRALLRGALLRSERAQFTDFDAVLGVRRGPAERGQLRTECARQYVRAASGLPEVRRPRRTTRRSPASSSSARSTSTAARPR